MAIATGMIAAIIMAAGAITATGISAYSSSEAIDSQEKMWKEQMEQEEEAKKQMMLARQRETFEKSLNKSEFLKSRVSSLWAGRGS